MVSMNYGSSLNNTQYRNYFAWFSVSMFYFYQYLLRVSPGIMINELRLDFNMTAEQFSTLGSYYLYAYALVQIPLGILVDQIGVRRTISFGIILCILGAMMLSYSEVLWMAQLSRVLVGAGSGTAFLCAVKLASDLFVPGKRGMLMGGTLTIGLIGAMTAGASLIYFVNLVGWRETILYCSFVGLGSLLFVMVSVPKRDAEIKKNTPPFSFEKTVQCLLSILKNPMIILFAVLAIGVYTPISVLADLWGTDFLIKKYGFARADAAFISTTMYLGMGAGSLILPWICERLDILNKGIQLCTFGLLFMFAFVLFGPTLSPSIAVLCLFILGFFCGAEMMCFTGAALHTTPFNSGMTIGVVNTLNMLGGALLQQGIGKLLDFYWSGEMTETGIRSYSSEEYSFALSILLIVIAGCCLIALLLNRHTYSKTEV